MYLTTFSLSSISYAPRPQNTKQSIRFFKGNGRTKQRERERVVTKTSRSSLRGASMSLERRLRLPADHRRVTVPVNIDQRARRRMAPRAQNLYRPLPNKLAPEDSFFAAADDANAAVVVVDIGRESSSFIIRERSGKERSEDLCGKKKKTTTGGF
ncbi:hypothetical protein Dimus_017619 [Dionaea muscipula]